MTENMDFVNKRVVGFFDNEKTANKQIMDIRIEKIFNDNKYDNLKLRTIFESLRYNSIEKIAINEMLWDLKYIHKINMYDVFMYLLQFSDPVKILKILNNEILTEFKNEIMKNNVKIKKMNVE